MKQPLWIAAENLGDLLLHLLAWHSHAVDDPAEIRFIDTHQLSQPVLAHAGCVNTQFQIGVNVPRFIATESGDWTCAAFMKSFTVWSLSF